MWSAFHMSGNSPAASGTLLSVLSSHLTHQQYHLEAPGHSTMLTYIKGTNTSIGPNTKTLCSHSAQNNTARIHQMNTRCRNKSMGKIPLIFPDQVIRIWEISVLFQKRGPGLFLKILDSEIFWGFAVNFYLIQTKRNNFPSSKPVSRSLNDQLPNLVLAASPPCLLFPHAIDVRPNLIPI